MSNVGTLTAHLAMDTTRLQKGARKGRDELGRFTKGANQGLGSVTSSVGKLGAAFGGLAAAMAGLRLFKDVTKAGEEFEQSITTAGAVMRATTMELQGLNDVARQMGETTEFTASQAAESLKFLGMAGFEASKAMAALPGTLDLATAGGIALGRSADIATNALTAMQLPVEELSRVNDVFIGTITRSNTDMEKMAETFKYVAPIGQSFGYSIEELSGMIGTLGNAGIQGSMAGTQLAMAIQKANDVAIKFGFSSSDLLDVLQSLNEQGRSSADIMDLFGLRAGRAALVLRDAVAPTRELQETLGGVGGEAEMLANKMRSTFGGTKKELISVMESIKIDVFDLYRGELQESMRDTVKWLRDNKEQILIWAQGVIDAFKIAAKAIKDFAMVIATAVEGLGLIFDTVQTESRATARIIAEDADSIANAFTKMNTTPLDEFFNSLANFWNAAVLVTQAAAEMLGTQLGAIASFVVDGLIGNFIDAFNRLVSAVVKFTDLDFSGAFDDIKQAGSSMADMWAAAGTAADVTIEGWADSYQKMVDGFDFRSKADKIIDREFKTALMEGDDVAASALERHRAGSGLVHQPKAVSQLTISDAETKAATKAAQEMIDVRVAMLEELLGAEGKSKNERMAIWEDYKAARIDQMKAEHQALLDAGADITLVTELVATRMEELNNEQRELFTEQASWLKEWAVELSEEMNATFSDMFFDTMKGEWQGLMEYMSNIWDLFLRKIADAAANELSDILGGGANLLGGLFGGGNKEIPQLAAGGFITRPTLAVVGESGPEAVIPLGKMRDEDFLNSFGSDGSGGNVSITVQTPDLPSFQRSRQQILTQTAAALRQARMRNA